MANGDFRLYMRIPVERWEEILAAAMLVGEPRPLLCSLCRGACSTKAIIGVRRCVQCEGKGFDYIGPETSRYAGIEQSYKCVVLDDRAEQLKHHAPKEQIIESMLLTWSDEAFMRKYNRLDHMWFWMSSVVVSSAAIAIVWSFAHG